MSIVEERPFLDPRRLAWIVYGLAAASAVISLWAGMSGSGAAIAVVAAIVLAPAPILLALTDPARFEVTLRGGKGFNPFLAAGVFCLLLTIGNQTVIGAAPVIVGWLFALVAGGASFLIPRRGKLESPLQLAIVLAAAAGLYAYAATIALDVKFDASAGKVVRVTVSDKYISRGRSTSYRLRLAPSGPFGDDTTISVDSSLYEAVDAGGQVCPTVHPGALGIGWYVTAACPTQAAAGSAS